MEFEITQLGRKMTAVVEATEATIFCDGARVAAAPTLGGALKALHLGVIETGGIAQLCRKSQGLDPYGISDDEWAQMSSSNRRGVCTKLQNAPYRFSGGAKGIIVQVCSADGARVFCDETGTEYPIGLPYAYNVVAAQQQWERPFCLQPL